MQLGPYDGVRGAAAAVRGVPLSQPNTTTSPADDATRRAARVPCMQLGQEDLLPALTHLHACTPGIKSRVGAQGSSSAQRGRNPRPTVSSWLSREVRPNRPAAGLSYGWSLTVSRFLTTRRQRRAPVSSRVGCDRGPVPSRQPAALQLVDVVVPTGPLILHCTLTSLLAGSPPPPQFQGPHATLTCTCRASLGALHPLHCTPCTCCCCLVWSSRGGSPLSPAACFGLLWNGWGSACGSCTVCQVVPGTPAAACSPGFVGCCVLTCQQPICLGWG